ncbi:uncharacterized protein LOC112560011 [Pomacea canaliculata]|uniref:uncharacterized protein LOC112560011 n=1 Tax=Pomacea canaliculata TaxID=400727 RepID=UPI000D737563|nr:uncharacterized protein LOC112560011 [Pomacea canaliculata]
MAFSQKLCALAEGKDTGVTETGLRWLNATRKCIQVELAPLLLPYESFTCSDVSAHAYEKQAGCYSKPYQEESGICSVSSADFWKIFWRTRDTLGLSFVESLLGLLKTKLSCTGGLLPFDSSMHLIHMRLQLPLSRRKRDVPSVSRAFINQESLEKTPFVMATRLKRHSRHVSDTRSSRGRRATTDGVWLGETNQQRLYHDLANKGALSISRLLGWDVQEVLWFAYGTKTPDSNVFNVSLLFVDKQTYGLQKNDWSPRVNASEAVIKAGQVLSRSDTRIMIKNQRAWMQKFQACSDINCQLVFYTTEQTDSAVSTQSRQRAYL